MSLEDLLVNSGAQNVETIAKGWTPDPKEQRAKEAHQMNMQYRKSVMDKNEADIKATEDDQARKDIILNKGIVNNHIIGASDEYNRVLKETGGNTNLASEAGKAYFQANSESYLEAGDDGEDKGLEGALQMEHSQFGQTLQMMRSSVPTIQKHLRRMEELGSKTTVKAPKTRNVGEEVGDESFIVNQEWVPETQSWREVGRRPTGKGQQINLRQKPAEVAAGKDYFNALEAASNAEKQLFTVQKARALMPDIETGKLEPMKTWARQWGDALGVSVDANQMNDSISFRATMKTAVLDGMASIKGTASEADRKTVEDSVAAIESPMATNKFLIDTTESMAKRQIEKAEFMGSWARDHDSSLIGARGAWNKRINNIPLIKLVGKKPYHYYQYQESAMKANAEYFKKKGWSEEEINDAVDRMWIKEGS